MDEQSIKKLKEIVADAKTCYFVSALDERPLSSRPMVTLQVDDDGSILFFSRRSSQKNFDIENFQEVQLFYTQTDHEDYLTIYGTGEVIADRSKIELLWDPSFNTWFDQGKDDAEITIIKVTPEDINYWDSRNNRSVQLMKIAVGAIANKPFGVDNKIEV